MSVVLKTREQLLKDLTDMAGGIIRGRGGVHGGGVVVPLPPPPPPPPPTALSAVIIPASQTTTRTGAGSVATTARVEVVGGTPPYTYLASGGGMTVNNGTTSNPTFSKALASGDDTTFTIGIQVTDSAMVPAVVTPTATIRCVANVIITPPPPPPPPLLAAILQPNTQTLRRTGAGSVAITPTLSINGGTPPYFPTAAGGGMTVANGTTLTPTFSKTLASGDDAAFTVSDHVLDSGTPPQSVTPTAAYRCVSDVVITPPPPPPPGGGPPAGAIRVNPVDIFAKVYASVAGDNFLMDPGTYPPLDMANLQRTDYITLWGQTGVFVPWVNLTNNKYVRLRRIKVNSSSAGVAAGSSSVFVGSSDHIVLDQMDVNPGNDNANGLVLRNVDTISITLSSFAHAGNGIIPFACRNVDITDNTFTHINVNNIFFNYVTDLNILRNLITRPLYASPDDGQHRDSIQGASSGAPDEGWPSRSARINISNNTFFRGDGGAQTQGIGFLEECDDVTLQGNANHGTLYDGISISGGDRILVDDNLVQGRSDPDPGGNPGTGTRILIRGNADHVTVTNNKSGFIGYLNNAELPPHITPVGIPSPSGAPANLLIGYGGNTFVDDATGPTDTAVFMTFLAAHPTNPVP